MISFFGLIWRAILEAIWYQLKPILIHQTLQKWGQVGHKIEPSWGVDLRHVFSRLLYWLLYILVASITWPRARFHRPCRGIINFFVFWLLWCWVDFLIEFWLIFGRFGRRKSMKIRSKIHPKGDRKQDASWDGVWMALGSIFGRFWSQVGRQVEAKLDPKSTKMALQKDVQKMITNLLCRPVQEP